MSKRSLHDLCVEDAGLTMNGLNSDRLSPSIAASEADLKKVKLDDRDGYHGNSNGCGPGMNGNGRMHDANGVNGSSIVNGSANGNGSLNHAYPNHNVPSKVVHIRGISNDCTEGDIMTQGLAFGRINNLLILKGKNQAFLEFADEQSASHMVQYYGAGYACIVKNKQCFVQFSTHKSLKTDHNQPSFQMQMPNQMGGNQNGAMKNGNLMGMMMPGQNLGLGLGMQNANLMASLGLGLAGLTGNGAHGQQQNPLQSSQQQAQQEFGGINTILRVVVENSMYPVTLDILNGIFSRFGKVLRIITFNKNHQFQALIQYPDRQSASLAKQNLDGQNVYAGCCTLRIEYSRLENLRVNFNNDKSRDYTNPNLPCGDQNQNSGMELPLQGFNPSALAGLSPHSLLQAMNSPHSQMALSGLNMSGLGLPSYNPSLFNAGALNALGGLSRLPMSGTGGAGCVVLVSNMNEEMVTPEVLFLLFGVYGDVLRVKILFNKKDTALVQYAEARQAQLAIVHLDRVKVYGKPLKVSSSRHQEVQLPKDNQPDCGLTRDFSNSPLHRFKKPGSKNYLNIYPPQATLHLSNLPPNVTEEQVMEYFVQNGFAVKHFRFFPKDHKMALIQLDSVEQAVEALIKMHNFQLNENTHLRVSFSKATIKE